MATAYNPQSVEPFCLATSIMFILIFADLVNNKRAMIVSVLSLIDGYSESYTFTSSLSHQMVDTTIQ